jgi:hypothetical protein
MYTTRDILYWPGLVSAAPTRAVTGSGTGASGPTEPPAAVVGIAQELAWLWLWLWLWLWGTNR